MTNKKILDYFTIEGTPGGNQDWLPEWDMNMGGCGAVTACDVCMYLARQEKFRALYKLWNENITRMDFIRFAHVMKPYLSPRYHGIDFLETYICGFNDYLHDVHNNLLTLEGVSGCVDYEDFSRAIIDQINNNFPVPFLLLNHYDHELEDFFWHWFNLAGYEVLNDNNINVLTVTYGEYKWLSLRNLHDTHSERRGGIIRIFQRV
ncbi:MAG: hypothetical protein IJP48_02940 [Synergistaceae bacterium]|nr:hypothetical protein [Synergistaceae bacterium]